MGWGGGGGARVIEFFFTKNPNLKKKNWGGWGWGGVWGLRGWRVGEG